MNILTTTTLTNHEFVKLSAFIIQHFGIKLPLSKKTMLEGRLQKRLKSLNIPSLSEYCSYVFSAEGQRHEPVHLIDVVTTNKTDFFRESVHFDFLSSDILPKYMAATNVLKPFQVWSAGCSSGEEPYTLAMVLHDFAERYPGFDFNILATDISTQALRAASTAVYTEEKVGPVPLNFKRKYLLKSKDAQKKTVRIVPELRGKVSFQRLNFLEHNASHSSDFNVVFCRNVLIYFDRSTQEKVILRLCSRLETGGHLFLGHSESISNMKLPLKQIKPTIFKKI